MIHDQLVGERDDNLVTLLPIHKFAIFLQFLRTNSFHKYVGSQHHIQVAKSVVCNNVNNVAKILAGLVSEVVKFPVIEESKNIANLIFQGRHSLSYSFAILQQLFLIYS
jgi:hypothetical protein